MTIESDNENKIVLIKIENKNINNPEDKLLLNILQSQGWQYDNSTILIVNNPSFTYISTYL